MGTRLRRFGSSAGSGLAAGLHWLALDVEWHPIDQNRLSSGKSPLITLGRTTREVPDRGVPGRNACRYLFQRTKPRRERDGLLELRNLIRADRNLWKLRPAGSKGLDRDGGLVRMVLELRLYNALAEDSPPDIEEFFLGSHELGRLHALPVLVLRISLRTGGLGGPVHILQRRRMAYRTSVPLQPLSHQTAI